MPVGTRRWHQGRNAGYQLQRREVQLVCLSATLVTGGLAALFGSAVHQFASLFAQAFHGKGWTGAVAQQPLQRSAVVGFDADPRVHREAAVLVGQHVFGVDIPINSANIPWVRFTAKRTQQST